MDGNPVEGHVHSTPPHVFSGIVHVPSPGNSSSCHCLSHCHCQGRGFLAVWAGKDRISFSDKRQTTMKDPPLVRGKPPRNAGFRSAQSLCPAVVPSAGCCDSAHARLRALQSGKRASPVHGGPAALYCATLVGKLGGKRGSRVLYLGESHEHRNDHSPLCTVPYAKHQPSVARTCDGACLDLASVAPAGDLQLRGLMFGRTASRHPRVPCTTTWAWATGAAAHLAADRAAHCTAV